MCDVILIKTPKGVFLLTKAKEIVSIKMIPKDSKMIREMNEMDNKSNQPDEKSVLNVKALEIEEKEAKSSSGMTMLILNILLTLASTGLVILCAVLLSKDMYQVLSIVGIIIGCIIATILCPILFAGLRVLRPNEAYVLTLFGRYYGTLRGPGFFFVHPFTMAAKPEEKEASAGSFVMQVASESKSGSKEYDYFSVNKKVSLKAITLANEKQKINDAMGNPIVIGIVVIWRVVNTAQAVFNVDNYKEYLSIQADSALRNVVRTYPYDVGGDDNEKTLRGSSMEVAEKIKEEIQEKMNVAGIEILEAKITHLSYAPEIAAAMLQRQQASAIVDARQMIVEGAVGMVDMALRQLNDNNVVELDEERKAAMVSNLLVVLCGNRDTQPIVNSGSLY